MNEIDNERMNEGAAIGQALIECLAKNIGCQPEEWAIDKAIYKDTSCGAWVRFTETGVAVGSIVEGSDAEVGPIHVPYDYEKEDEFIAAFWEAVQYVDDEACAIWDEIDADEADEL